MFRFVRRNPVFSAAVMALLGIGIGASTVLFAAINAFFLRPLPVASPERLARLGVEASATHVSFDQSGAYAQVLADGGKSFDAVFTCFPEDSALVAGKHVETVTSEVVSDNYFAVLGLSPEKGRFFDGQSAASLPAVVSHELAHRMFGASERAIGAGIRLRGAAFTVTGVLPRDFGGLVLERRSDVWVPRTAWRAWINNLDPQDAPAQVFVRLREGVSLSQAEAEVRVLYPSMVEADLGRTKGITASDIAQHKRRRVVLVSAEHGISAMRKQFSAAVPVLLGGIGALLVLMASNVSGLMLARYEARRAEVAIRRGLGASGWDIVRAITAESVVLAAGGALLGWIIAEYCGAFLTAFLPTRYPLNVTIGPDLRVLAFTTGIAAGLALLVSVAPALSGLRTDVTELLGRGGARVTLPVLGRFMVAVQVALAVVVVATGLSLERTLSALRTADPGFDIERLIVAVLDPRVAGVKGAEVPKLHEEILRRTRELPGVAGASLAGAPLMRGVGFKNTMGPAGVRLTLADRLNISLNYASETHFDNLGMKLVAGRAVTRADVDGDPQSAVVTESLARQFFPATDGLGREFGPAGPDGVALPKYRVVGVVRDAKYRGMREVAPPTFFTAFSGDEELVTLHVRTQIPERYMIRNIRTMLATIGPGLSPLSIATMHQEIEMSLWQERMLSFLSAVLAALATLVAGLGLFGLIAFTLERRTREVGIRVAVGATPRHIIGLFARHASAAATPGIVLGLAAFAGARTILQPLLFGTGARIEVPLAGSAILLALVLVLSVAIPFIRAIRVEPTVALRQE